jgi:hypothetical protein
MKKLLYVAAICALSFGDPLSAYAHEDPAILAKGYTFVHRFTQEKNPLLPPQAKYNDYYLRVSKPKQEFELLVVEIEGPPGGAQFTITTHIVECAAPASRLVSFRYLDAHWVEIKPPTDTKGTTWKLPQLGSMERMGLSATCSAN